MSLVARCTIGRVAAEVLIKSSQEFWDVHIEKLADHKCETRSCGKVLLLELANVQAMLLMELWLAG